MGIQDRDYYREGPSFLDRMGQQGATVWIVAITVGLFFGQALTAGPPARVAGDNPILRSPLVEYGAFDQAKVLEGEVWRLLTPLLLHSGIMHLFGNMLVLFFTASRLEERYGSREIVLLYLASGLVSSLIYMLAQVAGIADTARAVGASGAVFGVLIVYAFHYPRQQVLLFFVIPMPVWLLATLWVGFDALSATGELVNPNAPRGRTAYFAHLGGALFGLLYYQLELNLSAVFVRSKRARARPRLRVIPAPVREEREPEPVGAPVHAPPPAAPSKPADEQLEAKVDAVLEKVSKHGQESLTAEEREILFKASELYKKRRK
jgi:membrane associated rhomboid family serine protease